MNPAQILPPNMLQPMKFGDLVNIPEGWELLPVNEEYQKHLGRIEDVVRIAKDGVRTRR